MSDYVEIQLPTDVIFNGERFFDIEYPYNVRPMPIEASNTRLSHTYKYQRHLAVQHCQFPNFKSEFCVWGGGSPMNGAMGFLVAQDAASKVLWYVTLDEGNPVCEVCISDKITAKTTAGYQIIIEAAEWQTVNIEIAKLQKT